VRSPQSHVTVIGGPLMTDPGFSSHAHARGAARRGGRVAGRLGIACVLAVPSWRRS
jgi:hypothetical protein